jgi:hypothetical protein
LFLAQENQFENQAGITFFPQTSSATGTVIHEHPALKGFPHDGFCDLQFFSLMDGGSYLRVSRDPEGLVPAYWEPIIEGLHLEGDWKNTNKPMARTGFLLQTRVGRGRLLLTTFKICENFDGKRPEAIYFFDRLLRYVMSPDFQPRTKMDDSEFWGLVIRYF